MHLFIELFLTLTTFFNFDFCLCYLVLVLIIFIFGLDFDFLLLKDDYKDGVLYVYFLILSYDLYRFSSILIYSYYNHFGAGDLRETVVYLSTGMYGFYIKLCKITIKKLFPV